MKNRMDGNDALREPSRRKLMQAGLLGGVAAALTPAANAAFASSPTAAVPAFELDEITVADLQKRMQSGELTTRAIVEKYLGRIDAIDQPDSARSGPALRSVIQTNPDALKIADQLDRDRKSGVPHGHLHGIPVLIKDNIDTADNMMTTAGSLALVGSRPPKDSFVARKLREAGALILGKTNCSEWANIRSSHSTSGWSGRGGQTRNPYALDRNPCGSSSGSGAGVSANLAALSIGTETNGSIVCPSSINGVVGIKPTVGLISRAGIIPISHTQDTSGPMCRTVRDAAILLGALTGIDPEDVATFASAGKSQTDYTRFLDPRGVHGMRIGVVRKLFGFNEKVDPLIEGSLDVLKKLGAVLVDPADITTMHEMNEHELSVLLYELKADLNAYLAKLGPSAPVHTLKDIIEFNERNRETEMPYFGQDTFLEAEKKGPLTEKAYMEGLAANLKFSRTLGINATMEKFKLDALVAPTAPPAWLTDLINGDSDDGGSSGPAAIAGYPSITVPAGFIFGMPVGITFFGRAWSEPTLLKIGYAFEQATNVRRPPKFLPTADLTV